MTAKPHKSGFVSIIGKPNAGKSTLLNAILGRHLSIVTPKASTTRHRILGIDNGDDYQIVFSDTPGVIKPKYRLHNSMMGSVSSAVEDADLILLVISMDERFPESEMLEMVGKSKSPILLVANKVDLANPEEVQKRLDEVAEILKPKAMLAISATEKFNIKPLRELILEFLPEGPAYFDKEQLSDRPERFFVAELIREHIFRQMRQELPYSTEVVIEKFEEEENITRISAVIHVERKSQKGMVIGKGGANLKKVGQAARYDIERFLQQKVFLELFVKVSEGWKDSNSYLRGFGYD
ncbi:MAG: GTPase Era [Bacteroidia bacterium]